MSLASDELKREQYFRRSEMLYSRQIAGIYRDALDEIRSEMSKIYEKHAVKGVLTKAEMTRYNRLANMEAGIEEIYKPAVKSAAKVIDKLRPEEYGEGFFRTAWAIDNETGVALKWGLLDRNAIVANLANPAYEESIKTLTGTAIGRMRVAVSQGLALGKSYDTMLKDIKGVVNLKNFETMRILRTELHTAQEAGTLAGYADALDMGIQGNMVWMATLDGSTRDTHQDADGQAQVDGYFTVGGWRARYPGDPDLPAGERINCRCTTRFELDGLPPAIRRSREDGIIPYQTYGTWIEDRKLFA